ncbi:MAG: hypothetical protein WCK02_09920 [Bacteroidota bacterium]
MNRILVFVILFAFIFSFSSCEIINPEETIPSYIHIDSISFKTLAGEGANTKQIKDAWVYVDNQSIGCFELPATIPILASGEHKIDIRPGIKLNGISATRSLYPYYKPYITTLNLTPNSILQVDPSTSYLDDVNFKFIESFEPSGIYFEKSSNSDTNINITSTTNITINQGSYASIFVNNDRKLFECINSLNYPLSKYGSPAFIELDCKSNIPFTIGVFVNNPTQSIQRPLVVITKSENWKKLYINLTGVAQEERNAIDYKVFFGAQWDAQYGVDTGYILIDNIKLIN